MYCKQCQKEVVIMGIGGGAASPQEIEAIRQSIEAEGKIALFNPPPFGPYVCPNCFQPLDDSPEDLS